MGRSTTHTSQNPATKFYKWKDGKIAYYDGEKDVEVPFSAKNPFRFLVVERGAQIVGGTQRDGKYVGFYSNFVLNTQTQPFTVRSKQGVEAQGLYKDIKTTPGIKYATALYIGVPTDNGLELQFISFSGAALNAWIEATKKKDIFKGAFGIIGAEEGVNGRVTYYSPVFKHYPEVSEKSDFEAKALDEQLQDYLKGYFAPQAEEVAHDEVTVNENFVTAAAGAITSSVNGTQVQDSPNDNWHENEPPEGFEDSLPF
jgi:hypothetical protein